MHPHPLQETGNPLLTYDWCLVSYFRYASHFWLVEHTPPCARQSQAHDAEAACHMQEQTCTEKDECAVRESSPGHTWRLCPETGKGNTSMCGLRFFTEPFQIKQPSAATGEETNSALRLHDLWRSITFPRWKHIINLGIQKGITRDELQPKLPTTAQISGRYKWRYFTATTSVTFSFAASK